VPTRMVVTRSLTATLYDITKTPLYRAIEDGDAYSVSHRFTNVGSDNKVRVCLINPSASNIMVKVIAVEVTTFAQAWVDVYRDAEISGGLYLDPVNLNFDSNKFSGVTIMYGFSHMLGVLVHSTVVPGGTRINAVGGFAEVGESVLIGPGHNLVIEVTNKSTTSSDISIRIIWFETRVAPSGGEEGEGEIR